MKKGTKYLIFELVGVVALFLVWWLISAVVQSMVIPNPAETMTYLFSRLLNNAYFWKNFGISLLRLIIAFSISFALALVFGILGGLFTPVRGILKPLVTLFRSIPVIIVVFVVFIFFRTVYSPYIVAFLMIFPLFYESISTNLAKEDENIINSLKVDGAARNLNGLFRVRIPLIKDQIFIAMFQALGLGFKTVIMAEALTGDTSLGGIGRLLYQFQISTDIIGIFALACMIVVVILIFDLVLFLIKHYTIDKLENKAA